MLAVFGLASDHIALSPGTTFSLPSAPASGEAAVTPELVVLIMPVTRESSALEETVVFFNDSRYVFSDAASTAAFKNELGKRVSETDTGTLLLLADKRVNTRDLLRLVDLARNSGVKSVQIAEKRE
jgi:biopolymer transport protein ExbD